MTPIRSRELPRDDAAGAALRVATSIRLTPRQVDFLDRFRARVARDTGFRISRVALLRILVDVVSAAPPDLRHVASESDLTRRLCEASGLDDARGRR